MDGARPVKNSGRGIRKGDAELFNYLVDYKDYTNSFSISYNAWRKHAKDSWNSGHMIPLIAVTLNPKDKKKPSVKVGIVPWERLMELERIEQKWVNSTHSTQ